MNERTNERNNSQDTKSREISMTEYTRALTFAFDYIAVALQ